jgi:8-oxo-dGTP diphosphatase
MNEEKARFTVGVFAVVENEKGELLLFRDRDNWKLPGAGMRKGENCAQCAVRVIKEMFGMDVKVIDVIALYTVLEANFLAIVLKCKSDANLAKPNEQSDFAGSYFASNQLPDDLALWKPESDVKFTVGVFAVAINDAGEVLLCQRRDNGYWDLPGGGLHQGENCREGVIRETKEETNVDVEVEKIVAIYTKIDVDDLVIVFLCKIIGGRRRINGEASSVKFFNPEKLPEKIIPRQRERLTRYLRQPDELAIMSQTVMPIT